MILRGLPDLAFSPDVFLISSPHRSSQVVGWDGRGAIVIDHRQILLTAVQDFFLEHPTIDADLTYGVAAIALSAACRSHYGLLEKAYVLTERWWGQRSQLAHLLDHVTDRVGYSACGMTILLHEASHLAIDLQLPATLWVMEEVRAALDEYVAALEAQGAGLISNFLRDKDAIATNRARYRQASGLDVPPQHFGDAAAASLRASVEQHQRYLRGVTTEVLREASCDVLACLAMLNLRLGRRLFIDGDVVPGEVSLPVAIDIMLTALRTNRLLMVQLATAQMADALGSSAQSWLQRPFSSMTARLSVTVQVLSKLAQRVEHASGTETGYPQSLASRANEIARRSVHTLLDPISVLGGMLDDRDAYESLKEGVDILDGSEDREVLWLDRIDAAHAAFPI